MIQNKIKKESKQLHKLKKKAIASLHLKLRILLLFLLKNKKWSIKLKSMNKCLQSQVKFNKTNQLNRNLNFLSKHNKTLLNLQLISLPRKTLKKRNRNKSRILIRYPIKWMTKKFNKLLLKTLKINQIHLKK